MEGTITALARATVTAKEATMYTKEGNSLTARAIMARAMDSA